MNCSDVLTFFQEYGRMCRMYKAVDNCKGCPLYILPTCDVLSYAGKDARDEIKKIVGEVQKWSDQHPPETYASKFLKVFPNADQNCFGDPIICRGSVYGVYCGKKRDPKMCHECWNALIKNRGENK